MRAIILLLLSMIIFSSANSSPEHFYLRARNEYLRTRVFNRQDTLRKRIFSATNCVLVAKSTFSSAKYSLQEKANRLYQSALSKYYDANTFYYSLPEEDRELIEHLINLHF
jgi:hypothetical protein